ncbi:MAG: mechanosensitive ion channel domain-containing protein, partial [Bacteroidales bacterium]
MAFIVVIIMGILAWYLLRDIVSGLILCSENGFEPGQVIKTPFIQGTIKKLGYRSIEIISSNGEQVKVPYTMLMNTTVIKPQDNSKWVENVINL